MDDPQEVIKGKDSLMKNKIHLPGLMMAFTLCILLIACTDQPDTKTQEGRCGDGICDSQELQNPKLCPEDCSMAGEAEPAESSTGCTQGEWALIIDGCTISQGTETSATMCVYMNACVNLDESCQFEGIAYGNYKDCAYTSPTGVCTYEVTCPDFQVPVNGEVLFGEDGQQTFRIRVDASNVFEDAVANCAGVTVPLETGSMLQIGFGSAVRNNVGFFAEVDISGSGPYQEKVAAKDSVAPIMFPMIFWLN